MPSQLIRFFLISLLVIILFSPVTLSKYNGDGEDEEDLSYPELDQNDAILSSQPSSKETSINEDETDEDDFDDGSDYLESAHSIDSITMIEVDDPDVVVLTERNISDVLENSKYVMVEFYAPWCGHCQSLAPEYAAAATELKGEGVVLAKVDATEENELAHEYDVKGFPTVLFFIDSEHIPYTGRRTKDAIVPWIRKKIGPSVHNITTIEDAEHILALEDKVVLGVLNSFAGPEIDELASASLFEDDLSFYQTVNPDVAELFHIDASAKRPVLVLIKKEAEKLSYYDGQFNKSAIAEFVLANKLPLVSSFSQESAPLIFSSPIKKQMLLFAIKSDSKKLFPTFEEAAKSFRGKLLFVYIQMDNKEFGKQVTEYFGVSGKQPKILAFTGTENPKKYILDGEVTLNNIKVFGEDVLAEKIKPFYKSDPIPETNTGVVKIVVANNFDEIVLDESKDVLLEIYAPWCGHCKALEPTYNKLAAHLHGIKSIVIAKMDGTTNEHPKAKFEGFPTLLFFPAGNKSFDPTIVDADLTVAALYKFIKKHATVPFKLQRPVSPSENEASGAKEVHASSSDELKDEL